MKTVKHYKALSTIERRDKKIKEQKKRIKELESAMQNFIDDYDNAVYDPNKGYLAHSFIKICKQLLKQ